MMNKIFLLLISFLFLNCANDQKPLKKEELKKVDPIPTMAKRLAEVYGWTDEDDRQLVKEAHAIVDEAIQYARDSEYPEPEEAMEKVFV